MSRPDLAPLVVSAAQRLASHPAVLAFRTMPETDQGLPAVAIGWGCRVHARDDELTVCGKEPTLELGGQVAAGTPGLCELCDTGMRIREETVTSGYRIADDGSRTWKSEEQEAWERGFSRRLRISFDESGLGYARLARLLGVTHTTVERWVRGELVPVGYYMVRLGELLEPDDPLYLIGR